MELGTVAIIGVILLAIAIAWGMYQNSRRDRRKDPCTDEVTRELYDSEPEVEPDSHKP